MQKRPETWRGGFPNNASPKPRAPHNRGMGARLSNLERARRERELSYQRAVRAVSAPRMLPAQVLVPGGGGYGAIQQDAEGRQRIADATEQLSHFRGQVYTSIRPIAQRIAGQPIRLARIGRVSRKNRAAEPREYPRREVEDLLYRSFGLRPKANEAIQIIDQHPILDRFHSPAPSLPGSIGSALIERTVESLKVCGYGYWWFPVVKGIKEIHYLPPNWLAPVSDDKGLYREWILTQEGGHEDLRLPSSEIAFFMHPDPRNPLRGLGPLEAGARAVLVEEFVQECIKRAFQRGIWPTALVKVNSVPAKDGKLVRGRMTQAQMDVVRQNFMARNASYLNAGAPLFADGKFDIEPWGYKAKDMDFGMNSDKTRERVEQVFGTSPYVVGAAGLGSRAESAEADAHFVFNTVNPTIELMSQVMTILVLPQFDTSGVYVLFIEPARPRDSELQQKSLTDGLTSGAVTINMFLTEALGYPPVPWGDAVILKTGMAIVPVSQLKDGFANNASGGPMPAEVGQPEPAKPTSTDDNSEPDGSESPDQQGEQIAEGEQADKSIRVVHKARGEAFYKSFVDTWLKSHESGEKALTDTLLDFQAQQAETVVRKLQEFSGVESTATLRERVTPRAMAEMLFKPDDWVGNLKDAVRTPLLRAMVSGAVQEIASFGPGATKDSFPADLGFGFDIDLPADVRKGIASALDDTFEEDYWTGIEQTVLDDLEKTFADAFDDGTEFREITKQVEDILHGEGGRNRAANIARTEMTGAMGAGQHEARLWLEEEDVVNGKEWIDTGDTNTRDTHLAAGGQTRKVKEEFDVGGYPAMYPGDRKLPAKERCRCRCSAVSTTVYSERGAVRIVVKSAADHCEVHGPNRLAVRSAWPYERRG